MNFDSAHKLNCIIDSGVFFDKRVTVRCSWRHAVHRGACRFRSVNYTHPHTTYQVDSKEQELSKKVPLDPSDGPTHTVIIVTEIHLYNHHDPCTFYAWEEDPFVELQRHMDDKVNNRDWRRSLELATRDSLISTSRVGGENL